MTATVLITSFSFTGVLASTVQPEKMDISQLANYATSNQVNIMVYDSDGLINSEFHTDGEKLNYEVDKKTKKVKQFSNSNGTKTILEYNPDNTASVKVYDSSNKLLNTTIQSNISNSLISSSEPLSVKVNRIKEASKERNISPLSQNTLQNGFALATLATTSSDYYSNGYNMSNMCPSVWTVAMGSDKFGRPTTAMTQTAIQSLLVNRNSVLKNAIQVWALNSSGQVYFTGRTVTPSVVIDNASNNYWVNPKVIIATIQKESGLITKTSGDVTSRSFYYCMGYGATDGGDIYSYAGFDTQINGGTKLFLDLWNEGFDLGQSGFPISYVDSARISLPIDNCGTYALYRYTPWVSSNLLFLQCMKMFWPGTEQNNINWN